MAVLSEINDIKRRLSAVAQTRQITNAMYLLSSSRMRREAQRAGYAKEYFHRIRATVKDIMEKSQSITHPYFEKRSGNRAAFLVIAGDKGLCGTYNSDVLKYAHALISEHPVHYIKTVGRIATEFFTRRGIIPDDEMLGAAHQPTLYTARDLSEKLFELYENGQTDEIYIVFTRFENSAVHYPYCMRLLPMTLEGFEDVENLLAPASDMIYAPSPREVFDRLVPQCAVGLVFAALVQSSASEHSARMNAMQNATENADEMSQKLTREYQTLRQLSITNEIIEISSGAQGASRYGTQSGVDTEGLT